MSQTKTINWQKYYDWVAQGRTFGDIRKDLQQQGFEDEKIEQIIRLVDDHVTRKDLRKSERSVKRQVQLAGFTLLALGVFATAYTFFSGGSYIILAYGPIGGERLCSFPASL